MGKILKDFLGKHILLGLTYRNGDGSIEKMIEIHGIIVEDKDGSPALKIKGKNESFRFPPAFDYFQPADPENIYRLKSTGEQVSGIEFTGMIEITKE